MIDKERVYRLAPDMLLWQEGHIEHRLPYSEIGTLRLIAYAGTGGEQYQCTLTAPGKGKMKIRSHHYAGLSNFENRTATYAPFILIDCRSPSVGHTNSATLPKAL